MRASPNRSADPRAGRLPRAARGGARALAGALLAGALGASPVAAEEPGACAPLPPPSAAAPEGAEYAGSGIAPSRRALPPSSDATGAIAALSGSEATLGGEPMEGEAILALPKRADGSLAEDYVLSPDAAIEASYWSPVLCATLVRVVGLAGMTPQQLVPVVPADALVVPNHRFHTAGADVRAVGSAAGATGPDPYVPLQWGLARTGALAGRPAWTGDGVRVAVLDSAPDVATRELARVRIAALEDGPPVTPAVHGTLVAGVIGAIENNAFGIAGVAPAAELVAIPVCAPVGGSLGDECRMYDVLHGLDRAWQEAARVASLAIVGPPDPLLQRAVERMAALGVLLVAAAGNDASDRPHYPAAYPSVIGVGAMDVRGRPWSRTNRGAWLKLLAPGTEILSTTPGNGFAFADGTSLAAAHVTGLAALLLSGDAKTDAVRAALVNAAGASRKSGGTPALPKLCDVLPALGGKCATAP